MSFAFIIHHNFTTNHLIIAIEFTCMHQGVVVVISLSLAVFHPIPVLYFFFDVDVFYTVHFLGPPAPSAPGTESVFFSHRAVFPNADVSANSVYVNRLYIILYTSSINWIGTCPYQYNLDGRRQGQAIGFILPLVFIYLFMINVSRFLSPFISVSDSYPIAFVQTSVSCQTFWIAPVYLAYLFPLSCRTWVLFFSDQCTITTLYLCMACRCAWHK